MRIAYVALHLEKKYIYGGVGRKIRTHLRIWQEMGHNARLFLLSPDDIDLPDIFNFSIRFPSKNCPISGIRTGTFSQPISQKINPRSC